MKQFNQMVDKPYMSKRFPLFLILILCALASNLSLASDIVREKRIADDIKDSIIVGDVVDLKAGGTEFIGLINNEKPDKPRGSIIILHGMGSNPNAPQIIHPLRSQLAELGWITASIQLPIAAQDASIGDNLALIKESSSRIKATLSYMHENFANTHCILIAHSLGSIMATHFLASQDKPVCDAVVLISMPTLASDLPEANSIEQLKKINIPTLDIYGSQDLTSVRKLAPTRKLSLMKNNPLNRQIEISGADHVFTGLNDTLVRSIHGWLVYIFEQDKS
jgi:predicted alpha/beta-hydrolase family hydrolase